MILNLHGLNGRSRNNNYQQLLRMVPEDQVHSPQIDYLASDPRELLRDLAAKGPYTLLVGQSLGGFVAYALGAQTGCRAVLTNPCVPPHEYLPSLTDGYAYLDALRDIWEAAYPARFDCRILVGTRDEVVDHRRTLELMQPHYRVETIDCGHTMEGEDYPRIFEEMCEP